MRFTREERIDIGRQVYTKELTRKEAMEKYKIARSLLDLYIQDYKLSVGIPVRESYKNSACTTNVASKVPDIEAYQAMSKEELINELIKAKANELRAKKGYEVKGDGANKEFIILNRRNSK
jgi:transposase